MVILIERLSATSLHFLLPSFLFWALSNYSQKVYKELFLPLITLNETHKHTRTHAHRHTRARTQASTQTRTNTHTHMHTHTHTHTHKFSRTPEDRPVAETFNCTTHTIHNRQTPMPRWDSNPQFQQANRRRRTP